MKITPFLVVFLALLACAHPSVRIRNESGTDLRNVRLSGRGFTRTVAYLPKNESCVVEITPDGESGVAVAFDSNGRHVETPQQGYVEDDSRYSVDISVSTNLAVRMRNDLVVRN